MEKRVQSFVDDKLIEFKNHVISHLSDDNDANRKLIMDYERIVLPGDLLIKKKAKVTSSFYSKNPLI